jgi:hypothetical protein
MPLDVIGAGQGRTGTASLKLALEQLGFGPPMPEARFYTATRQTNSATAFASARDK